MIAVGDVAPEFSEASSQGTVQLRALRGGPVVLYFYPEADTPGCTVESKKLRDLTPKLSAQGVRVVGVSTDSVDAQCAFRDKYALPFPLVADVSKKIATSYGVLRPSGRARRVTFFIDKDGKVIEVVDQSAADPHIAAVERRFLSAG